MTGLKVFPERKVQNIENSALSDIQLRQKQVLEGTLGKYTWGRMSQVARKSFVKKLFIPTDHNTTDSILEDEKRRILDEIECMVRVGQQEHPNIIKYIDSFRENKEFLIVMEYCLYGDMETFLKNHLRHKNIIRFALDCASAIVFLHNVCNPAVVHRDIKLKNFLVTSYNGSLVIKLCDFGLSKILPEGIDVRDFYMTTGAGTQYFMAPEMFEDEVQYKSSADIFSLGLVYLVLVTYEGDDYHLKPFSNATRRDRANQIYGQEIGLCRRQRWVTPKPFSPNDVSGNTAVEKFKLLVEEMVASEPKDRPAAAHVKERLHMITLE